MYADRIDSGCKVHMIVPAVVCLAVLALAACGGRYGSLQRSAETNYKFESLEISDQYNYYYTGAYYKPMAIIGLKKDHTLITKLWKPVDLTPKRLGGWTNVRSAPRPAKKALHALAREKGFTDG